MHEDMQSLTLNGVFLDDCFKWQVIGFYDSPTAEQSRKTKERKERKDPQDVGRVREMGST